MVFQVKEWPWVNHFKYSLKRMCWRGCPLVAKLVRLGYGALINVDAQGCYYIGGLRPDRVQLEYSCGVQLYSKVPSLKVPISRRLYVTQPHPNQRGHHQIRVNPCCTKGGT